MVEPERSDLVARAEALDKELEASSEDVRKRWANLQASLRRREELQLELAAQRRGSNKRHVRRAEFLFCALGICALVAIFLPTAWYVTLLSAVAVLFAGVGIYQLENLNLYD